MVNVWTIITTHNRHDMLHDLLNDVDRDRTVIVDHACTPPIRQRCQRVIRCDCPPNISHLWNLGLNWVDAYARKEPYYVAILNDDLRIPEGTLETIVDAMESTGAVCGFPDVHNLLKPGQVDVRTVPGPVNLFTRMTGFCFVLKGETGIRADERLVWWYGDDDIEWRAATAGGAVRVGGVTVTHLSANGSVTADIGLAEQTVKDRDMFIQKWGRPPW